MVDLYMRTNKVVYYVIYYYIQHLKYCWFKRDITYKFDSNIQNKWLTEELQRDHFVTNKQDSKYILINKF